VINLTKKYLSKRRCWATIRSVNALDGQLTIPPRGVPRKIRICPPVVSREIQNRLLSPARLPSSAFSLAFFPFLLLQAAVRNNLPSIEQSITLYNESLTQCQNADPLIFHVVSPGTRAVTAPPRPYIHRRPDPRRRRWSSKLSRRCHSLFTTYTDTLPFDNAGRTCVAVRQKKNVLRICFTDCLVKMQPPLFIIVLFNVKSSWHIVRNIICESSK
jgi:hypothetical protein